jgi:hypothetical protein
MKTILVTSCVSLWALTLISGCGNSGSHATDSGAKDSATESGTGGGDGGGGTDVGKDSGTDGGSCPGAGTCGGNIVGTWNITSSCLDVDVSGTIPADCPTATAQPVNFKLTGTITYRADLTYSRKSTYTGGVAITYPATCLNTPDAGTQTCAQLTTALQADMTYTDVACVAAGTGCTCTGTLAAQTTQNLTGMYTTSPGGLLTEMEGQAGALNRNDYCIMGDTLTTSPRAMGAPSASGTITATRVAPPDAGAEAGPETGGDGGSDAGVDAVSDAPKEGGSEAGPEAGDGATGN